jgi:hypothetical protein
LGYVGEKVPDDLYLAGNERKDCKILEGVGHFECDSDKAFFVSKVESAGNSLVRDEAWLRINGTLVSLKSKSRKSRGDQEGITGPVWLAGNGVRVLFKESGDRDKLSGRITLTIYFKNQKKSIILIPSWMGD